MSQMIVVGEQGHFFVDDNLIDVPNVNKQLYRIGK